MQEKRLASMLRAHGSVKAKIAETARRHKEEKAPLTTALQTIELGLLKMLNDTGSDSLKVKGLAIVIAAEKVMPSCKDWQALWQHVVETNNFDLVTRRLSSKHVKEYMETHGDNLPPGITIHVERGVSVRRQN